MRIRIFIATILAGMIFGTSFASAGDNTNEVTIGAGYYGINGDEGRFREDRFQSDKWSGGIESYYFSAPGFEVGVKSVAPDEYKWDTRFKKDELGYVRLKGRFDRRFFDGSNEAWDPSAYGYTGSEVVPDNRTGATGPIDDGFYSAMDFADRPDKDLYSDRMDLNLEVGLTKEDLPDVRFGWHRWERKGEELLLRSERAKATGSLPNARSIPALSHVDGQSDTFYVDVAKLVNERHALRFRQEFETYRDNQYSEFPRYKTVGGVGAIDQYRTFVDDPKFKSWVSLLSIDSRVSDDALLTGGYMYNYVKNESARQVVRPDQATEAKRYHTINAITQNIRKMHVGTLALRKRKLFGLKSLAFSGGLRGESADQSANTSLLSSLANQRVSNTSEDEWGVEENLQIEYRGLPDTSVDLRARFAQGRIDQRQLADMGSHETFDPAHYNSGIQWLDYAAKIKSKDQAYTLRLINRSLPVKLTMGGKYTVKRRDYDVLRASDPRFYPGLIGYIDTVVKEANAGLSKMLPKRGTAGLKYQIRSEDIITGKAANGRTQDWLVNRVTGNLAMAPTDKLYANTSLAYETYALNTPTDITGATDWALGTEAYDYSADYLTWLLNTSYAFTPAFRGNAQYQLTSALGSNAYKYHRIGSGVSYKIEGCGTVGLGAEYYDFRDVAGNGFDDYRGIGGKATYTYTF